MCERVVDVFILREPTAQLTTTNLARRPKRHYSGHELFRQQHQTQLTESTIETYFSSSTTNQSLLKLAETHVCARLAFQISVS